MKIIILTVAVALLLQGKALAAPQGFFDFNVFPIAASLDGQASAEASGNEFNPFAVFDASSNNDLNGFRDLLALFRSGAENLARSVSDLVSVRAQNIAQYAQVLVSYIAALKDEIDYSGVKSEFGSLERNLRSISNEADKFTTLLTTLQENRDTQISNEENNHAVNAAEWSSVLLDRLDSRTNNNVWARNEADSAINEFIQRHFDLQDSCKEEALAEIGDLERSAQKPLAQIEKIQEDFVNKLQTCASSTNNRAQQSRCKRDLRNISQKLTKAARDIRQLQNSARQLNNPRQQYKNRDCVKDTLLDYNLEKFSIELKIEAIISQASAHPNQTTQAESSTKATQAESSTKAAEEETTVE